MELTEINLSEEQLANVQRILQSEGDRIRTEYSRKNKELTEELTKYKPKEKSDSEKAFEERIAALEAKEKAIADKERAMTIADKLKEKNLPSELAQYLNIGDDMDEVIEKVGTTIGSYFLENGNRPTNHNTNKGITKSDFAKMSYKERAKLFQENVELYKALSK